MKAFAGMTEGGIFTPAPEGTHGARLLQVVDLGTQDGIYGPKRKLMITFELVGKLMDEGKPYTVASWYSASLNRKGNLRSDLTGWLGRQLTYDEVQNFSWDIFKGQPCLVTVTHFKTDKGDVRAKVQNVSSVPDGMQVASLDGQQLILDLENFDPDVFEKLSEGVQAMVMKSPEYQRLSIPSNGPSLGI